MIGDRMCLHMHLSYANEGHYKNTSIQDAINTHRFSFWLDRNSLEMTMDDLAQKILGHENGE